jgi:hypothetical protein
MGPKKVQYSVRGTEFSCPFLESNSDFTVVQTVVQSLHGLRYPGFIGNCVRSIMTQLHEKLEESSPISDGGQAENS